MKAVLKGIREQMKDDGDFRDVNALNGGPSPEEDEQLEDYAEDFASNEQRTEGQEENIFYDDSTGVQLDTRGVLDARKQEPVWIDPQSRGLHEEKS